MKRILFICSRNRLRSPTAEHIFANWPGVETASAGLAPDAEDPLTSEHLEGVDLVFVMEKAHRAKLNHHFKGHLKQVRVVCLNIPDEYDYMQPELVKLLEERVSPHLQSLK